MELLPAILASKDPFKSFGDFLADYLGDLDGDVEQQRLCFAWHLKARQLPGYADDKQNLRTFEAGSLPLSLPDVGVYDEVKQNIIEYAKERAHKKNIIQVDHFVIDFRFLKLHRKLQLMQKGQSIHDSACMTWTDFDLADLLLKIITKYPNDIENFPAVRNMVDY